MNLYSCPSQYLYVFEEQRASFAPNAMFLCNKQ